MITLGEETILCLVVLFAEEESRHGQYPTELRQSGPYGLGTGRILPSSSWDHVWNGISEWFGVEDLDYVVPNRVNWG